MDYAELGKTGLRVSRLAFGTLTIGPLQRNIDETVGSVIIRKALDAGINFLDTAQSYGTYNHIRRALEGFAGDVVIASKSGVAGYDEMAEAVEEADVVSSLRYAFDFPHLHAVAVGMLTEQELDVNLKIYYHQEVDAEELASAGGDKRMFVVKFCKGCGNCLEACTHDALSMVNEKAYIEHSKCVLCGYCRKECPHSMIRII